MGHRGEKAPLLLLLLLLGEFRGLRARYGGELWMGGALGGGSQPDDVRG